MIAINSIAACARVVRAGARNGLIFLVFLLLFMGLSPWLVPDPHAQNLGATLQPPGAGAWLGTDHLGRSVVARLGEAARLSLGLAFGSAFFAVSLGTALGLLAAWRGGWVDRLISLAADAVAALPGLLWVLLLAALAPGDKWPLYLGLVLTAWVEFFRYVRPTANGLLVSPQVQSSRLLGFGPGYILRRHLAPPMLGALLTLAAYAVANAVLAVAALGFVGVGLRPPAAELGILMTEALPYYEQAPWLLAAPVLLLLGVVLALQALSSEPRARSFDAAKENT